MWRLFDPRVERFLIADEGEVVIDEVTKHWAAMVKPFLELMVVVPLLALVFWLPPALYWVPLLGAPVLIGHALWRIIGVRMDRFVITNMRVFRVHGILSQHIATMPISRILDVSVLKPFVGRIFGFGHFIFESAAQDQGLKEIRYVGDPNGRGLTIQRVIQRSGVRGTTVREPTRPTFLPKATTTGAMAAVSLPPTSGESGAAPGASGEPHAHVDQDDVRTGPIETVLPSGGRADTWPGAESVGVPPASFHPNRVWPRPRRDIPQPPEDPDGT
ncbi:PH domain-containing protein [Agromyces sp. H66]|uniref:PH domain-containing protein n=1 Tax=Agromyces sp. H66 TaxID=2529859 RepID=UPI0010A9B7B7|nr:PH domain-containing protein [Agromyces sp. H66]